MPRAPTDPDGHLSFAVGWADLCGNARLVILGEVKLVRVRTNCPPRVSYALA